MALSADQRRLVARRSSLAFKIANAEVTYAGSLAALRAVDHATAASRGYADVLTAANGNIPLGGTFQRGATGDTSATRPPEGEVDVEGQVWLGTAVTGGAGDITDLGQFVYASDDATLTFTRPTLGLPIGVATRYLTGTNYNVYLFSFGELCAISLGGAGQDNIYLGSVDLAVINPNDPGGAKVNVRTGWPCPYHAKITDFFALVDVATVAASGTDGYDLNLELGGTDLTGGVLTIAGANAIGTKISLSSAQAITAANVMHEGDLLDVEVIAGASGDDMTAGRVDLWMQVERLAGY